MKRNVTTTIKIMEELLMPFDKFVDIAVVSQERRQAVQQSLRNLTIEELKKLVNDHLSEFEGDPWREGFLRLIAMHPQGNFYGAVTKEGAIILYSCDEDTGIWVLPGSGMGPLPEEGKRDVKEAIKLPRSTEKQIRNLGIHNPQIKLMNNAVPLVVVLVLVGLCVSCSRKLPQAGPPAPEVLVTTVQLHEVPIVKEGVATLDGFINANINAQVQGYLISRDYKEGSVVKKGDLLFQIDPRPFEASLAQAKANLAKDKAMQLKASADQKRAFQLFMEKVISSQERDAAVAAAESNKANVEADEAAVKTAELNLGYTKITAPVDGVAGIATAQVGDLVGPSTGTLTTVSQINPIKATVNLGERGFTEFLTKHRHPDERERYLSELEFELVLADGTVFPQKGSFYAEDRNLDAKTGSIKMEITFPNPGNLLRPGQFGKVRTIVETKKAALVVPQEAVSELQGNQLVMLVDQTNKVGMCPVKMGERLGALWEVTDGLKPGDRVIVQGFQKVRPGSPVLVKEWVPPATEVGSVAPLDSGKEQ
jgi:membrane fusion protein (multidrug efflux system)